MAQERSGRILRNARRYYNGIDIEVEVEVNIAEA